MAAHPDLAAEQAYIDRAYAYLEASREAATRLSSMVEVGRGGTEQARFERDVIWDTMLHRLSQLHLGDASLCFGRIDVRGRPDALLHRAHRGQRRVPGAGDRRLAGAGGRALLPGHRAASRWAWPAAATSPPGAGCCSTSRTSCSATPPPPSASPPTAASANGISGHGALISALETSRSGKLGDIVATIQGEQDEIIRADLPGVLVVQGGPGTGKTVVALHRAAYLLYTLPVPARGPGRARGRPQPAVPRLHRAGAAVARRGRRRAGRAGRPRRRRGRAGPRPAPHRPGQGRPAHGQGARAGPCATASARCARTWWSASASTHLRVTVAETERICREARRRFHRHNAGRRFVEAELFAALARSSRDDLSATDRARPPPGHRRGARGARVDVAGAHPGPAAPRPLRLEGAAAPRRPAASSTDDEAAALLRPRSDVGRRRGLDQRRRAAARRGPGPARPPAAGPPVRRRAATTRCAPTATSWSTRPRTCRPCSCACSTRRSLNGSMTVVGDIAQSTGEWAHAELAGDPRPPARPPPAPVGPSSRSGYRLPAPNMALASQGAARWPIPICRRRVRSARTATRRASCGPHADGLADAGRDDRARRAGRGRARATWP